jgi:hypothetical protein
MADETPVVETDEVTYPETTYPEVKPELPPVIAVESRWFGKTINISLHFH